MTKRQYKNRIKKVRVTAKRKFYLHFRPKAQKLFFPIVGIILAIACINYERIERGTINITNAAATQVGNQAQDQAHVRSAEAQMEDGTSHGKQAAVPVGSETKGDNYTHQPVTPESIETKILEAFNGDKVALAVAKSESGLDPNAKGWNCKYGTKSTSCKPEDRGKAWSVDCGIYQINSVTKDCPEHLMDVEVNIAIAKEMQSKRGWSPWVGYWNGQWKNHLN